MFRLPVRVYWEDTDAGGVVYHAQYLAFMERARSDWVRALGFGQEALRASGVCLVVAALEIAYRRPARLDDLLEVDVCPREAGRASVVLDQHVLRDGVLIAQARVRLACVDSTALRPCALPAELHAVLSSSSPLA